MTLPQDSDSLTADIEKEIIDVLEFGIKHQIYSALQGYVTLFCEGSLLTKGITITWDKDILKAKNALNSFKVPAIYNYNYACAARILYFNELIDKDIVDKKNAFKGFQTLAVYGDVFSAKFLVSHLYELYQDGNEEAAAEGIYWLRIMEENLERQKCFSDFYGLKNEDGPTEPLTIGDEFHYSGIINDVLYEEYQDFIQDTRIVLTPKFEILDHTITFKDSVEEYLEVNNIFSELMKSSVYSFRWRMKHKILDYEEFNDIKEVHDSLYQLGIESLKEVSTEALKIFAERDIYNLEEKDILQWDYYGISAIDLWKKYFHIIDQYVENSNEKILFSDKRIQSTLTDGLTRAIRIIMKEVSFKLGINPSTVSEINEAKTIMDNLNKEVIPPKKVKNAIATILSKNPFLEDVYSYYLKLYGDQDKRLECFAAYFGMADFVREEKIKIIAEKESLIPELKEVLFYDSDWEQEIFMDILNGKKSLLEGNFFKVLDALIQKKVPYSDIVEKIDSYTDKTCNIFKEFGFVDDKFLILLEELKSWSIHFYNQHLTNHLPDGIKYIQPFQFFYLSSFCPLNEKFTIPNTVEEIGNYSFADCALRSSVKVEVEFCNPSKLISLSEGCFYRMKLSVKSLIFPNNFLRIERFAFGEFGGNVVFSNKHIEFDQNSFYDNYDYIIVCDDNAAAYDYAVKKNLKCSKLCVKDMLPEKFAIPDYVTNIEDMALGFQQIKLKELIIPGSCKKEVTVHGGGKFGTCPNLRTVVFSEGVESIADYAFSDCEYLQKVVLPNSLKGIGERAFENCPSLKKIELPDNLVSIGNDCFDESVTVYCNSGTVTYDYCRANGIKIKENSKKRHTNEVNNSNKENGFIKNKKTKGKVTMKTKIIIFLFIWAIYKFFFS